MSASTAIFISWARWPTPGSVPVFERKEAGHIRTGVRKRDILYYYENALVHPLFQSEKKMHTNRKW
jgi:hypothetical protein